MAPPPLHPVFASHGSYADMKLGKTPKRDDPRTLMLAKYLNRRALPPIPPRADWTVHVTDWPMYDNDQLGDCTCAAAGHMIEAWTCNAAGCVVPADADIDTTYWETGDPPAATGEAGGPTDNGRNELDVLNYWRTTGVGSDKIAAYAAIDPEDTRTMKAAIFLFGGVYGGVSLPITAQTQRVWDVVGDGKTGDSEPGSWGGHAVPLEAFNAAGVTVVTWGALLAATWKFVGTYFEEAYAIITQDFITNGSAPNGFDLEALQTDLSAITS